MTALQRREERVIRMFKRCVERGTIPAEYALILIENDRAYGWMSDEAREEFCDWVMEIEEARMAEEVPEEPAEEDPEEEPEEDPEEDPAEEGENDSAGDGDSGDVPGEAGGSEEEGGENGEAEEGGEA